MTHWRKVRGADPRTSCTAELMNAGLPVVAAQASSSMSTTGCGQLPAVSLRNSSGDSSSNLIRRPKTWTGARLRSPDCRYSLVPTRANSQPAFGAYVRSADGSRHFTSLFVLSLAGDRISALVRFDASVLPWFGPPRSLPAG